MGGTSGKGLIHNTSGAVARRLTRAGGTKAGVQECGIRAEGPRLVLEAKRRKLEREGCWANCLAVGSMAVGPQGDIRVADLVDLVVDMVVVDMAVDMVTEAPMPVVGDICSSLLRRVEGWVLVACFWPVVLVSSEGR